jgi:L-asparaginase
VAVFGLGGTIAMNAATGGGVVLSLSAEQLIAAVPSLAQTGIRVEVEEFRRLPGASLRIGDIVALSASIRGRLAAGVDGVTVIQGTDTIEETAYLLGLTHPGPQPIVVTGAMRNPTLAGAAGPANLLAAVQVAASRHTCDQGVLVVFADDIQAARRVGKTHSTSVATFQSPNGGLLGYVVEGRPTLLSRLDHRTVLPPPRDDRSPTVGLLTVTLGDDGALLPGLKDRLDGLVLAAFGVGHVPEQLVPALADLAGRIPVVLASRAGSGPVLAATYAFPGSARDLRLRRRQDPLLRRSHIHPSRPGSTSAGSDRPGHPALRTGSARAPLFRRRVIGPDRLRHGTPVDRQSRRRG